MQSAVNKLLGTLRNPCVRLVRKKQGQILKHGLWGIMHNFIITTRKFGKSLAADLETQVARLAGLQVQVITPETFVPAPLPPSQELTLQHIHDAIRYLAGVDSGFLSGLSKYHEEVYKPGWAKRELPWREYAGLPVPEKVFELGPRPNGNDAYETMAEYLRTRLIPEIKRSRHENLCK